MTTVSSTTSSSTTSATSTSSSATTNAATAAANAGASILTSLGAGSGIDTATLITNLSNASFSTKEATQTANENANTAKISEVATLASNIDTFSTALNSLISGGTLMTQPSSSNTSVLTATAKSGAQLGNLSTQLVVKQIAKAQSLVSDYFTASTTTVGSGGLTLTTGSGTFNLTLDSSNNTLAGIAKAINAAGAGVTASIVTDATGARLAIKGTTGASNAFTITPTSGSDAALGGLAYPQSGGTGMTQAQAAQDAIVNVDGIDVSRSSNTIGDLIDGVTLTLVKASPTETIALGATRPTDAITSAISDFVSAYNSVQAEITSSLAIGGTFANNSSIRQMQTMLARLTSTTLNTSGGPSTLAELGVATARDGTLSVDSATLSKMLTNYPDGVEAMFNPSQRSSDPLIQITSTLTGVKPGTYQLTNIVADSGAGHPSGTISGVAGIPNGTLLQASITSDASGLTIQPLGDVASATVTIDSGIGGALQAIRDALRNTGGLLDTLNTSLTTQKTSLADARTKLTTAESNYKDRLSTQFSAMDTAVAAYKSTQAYLTQQIDLWTKGSS
jgi:flagellar hook-associated protein 2